MSPLRYEIRRLLQLAAPVVVTQLATMMLGVVDTLMVGHVSVQALGATSLGHIWVVGTVIFGMGVVFGMDPILTQAHGARDGRRLGRTLHRGLVVGLLVSLPIAGLWMLTGPGLRLFGQSPELAAMAHRYVIVQIPSLPLFMIFTALRQYLQARGIMKPAMYVAIAANFLNALFNWALIFGHLGLPRLEVVGAGVATSLTRLCLLLMLLALIRGGRLTRGARVPWSREDLRWRALREILQFGIPVGLQLSLEVWAFQVTTLLAGRLGDHQLAAFTVVLNLASITFMVPLGIGIAAVTRVGNLIGARDPQGAQRAAWVALGLGAGVMCVSATIFATFRNILPQAYTDDLTVRSLAAATLPIAAAFQLFDGTQAVGAGVLRGMGSTRPAAVINLLGYYLLALPLAWYLTFHLGWGLPGLWWGLAGGLAVVALMLVGWIRERGPGKVSTRPVWEDASA